MVLRLSLSVSLLLLLPLRRSHLLRAKRWLIGGRKERLAGRRRDAMALAVMLCRQWRCSWAVSKSSGCKSAKPLEIFRRTRWTSALPPPRVTLSCIFLYFGAPMGLL